MKPLKPLIVIALLVATIIVAFAIPRPHYKSPDIIPTLDIPIYMGDWRGRDISKQFNLNDERYKFIGNVFANMYSNYLGEGLILLILDAGNFHNPKVCMGASGYTSKDLPDTEFKTPYNTVRAHTVYFEKGDEGTLIIYWICINKKIVDWNTQKLIQLWYSLFNKEKVGLMVRLDISTNKDRIQSSVSVAKEFIADLSKSLPREKCEYVFGK